MVENAPWTEICVSQRLLYEIIILSLIKSSFMIAQTPENPWSPQTVFTKHNKFLHFHCLAMTETPFLL